MRLKCLEILGFKSFAQKTVIELNPGITAVVGPNGCGKSNIVDALRWAMGEQSARHLRGHQMEDVIFAGSDSLAPTGMAEVSITFDNEDGRSSADYANLAEIMVTRRLFRSGESEYFINKVPSRLKDVVELFLGSGVGSKAYSIIEQGRVDELVNSKPEDRRALIEEAAGTSKYKSRKLVAERKLERTQQNLLRVTDIVREIERQIRTMELQAKKAERYRALKSELRDKDLALAAVQKAELNGTIAESEAQLESVDNRLIECSTELRSKEAESESARLAMMEADKEIAAEQENLYQHRVQVQATEQRIDFSRRDLAQIRTAEEEARSSLVQLEEKLSQVTQEIAGLHSARENFVQLSLFEQSFLREKEEELEARQADSRALQAELDHEKEALIELASQIAALRNEATAKERRRVDVERELARNVDEHTRGLAALESSETKRAESHKALESCADQTRDHHLMLSELSAILTTLQQAKEEQERKIEGLKERIQEHRSRLVSLEDLQRNYEGYQEGVRAIMLKKQQEATPNGIYGLVADVIEAPESYEKALIAVLGDRLQYVIVKGHEEGVEAIDYLKREASGRGSFIPLELSRKLTRSLPVGEPEVVGPLLQMISIKDGYRDVAEYLLSDVVIVTDLKAGLNLWNRNGFHSTLVTPEGEVVDPMGTVTGGSGAPLEGSFLAQRRRMKELRAILSDLENLLGLEEIEAIKLKHSLEEASAKKSHLLTDIHRLEIERVRFEHEHLAAEQESNRLKQRIESLVQEQGELNAAVAALNSEIESSQREAEARCAEKNQRESVWAERQRALTDLKATLDSIEAAVTESRIRTAALGEKRQNTDSNLEARLNARQETSQQIASRRDQIADLTRRKQETENFLIQSETELETTRIQLRDLEEELQAHRQGYRNISRNVAEIEESIKELRPVNEAALEEKNRLQLLLAENRLKYGHLTEGIREKYDVDLAELTRDASEDTIPAAELAVEIEELRSRLERMGEVNLAAIGEYEELTSRFHFMSQQKQDLEKSIADLHQTIVKLNRICRLRFKESFEAINEKFEAIFPRLFRGGRAKLVLTDDNDYLETGVDIIVQPPGKKLQSITLLSGGEKALTAVSLLFAIFLTKPSPFCFLDEVDAPLDDANIDRFNDMIKEMSEFSQFILVTHNKKTMQAAEVLYGITMEEPGVSKVVSVRMS
ncbi:MAG TPA: chromosome segregation protein SMC [Candidatus Binatia bacterium]